MMNSIVLLQRTRQQLSIFSGRWLNRVARPPPGSAAKPQKEKIVAAPVGKKSEPKVVAAAPVGKKSETKVVAALAATAPATPAATKKPKKEKAKGPSLPPSAAEKTQQQKAKLTRLDAPSDSSQFPFTVPPPVERSPTDLLQALADTVGKDPTAAHYSYVDDPLMLPTFQRQKKNYLLSKEFGKMAGRRLVEEWPSLFQFDRDYPTLEAFRPEKSLDPEVVDPTEENLQKMVRKKEVRSATRLYQRIHEAGTELSQQAKEELFSLICYANEEDLPRTVEEQKERLEFLYNPSTRLP